MRGGDIGVIAPAHHAVADIDHEGAVNGGHIEPVLAARLHQRFGERVLGPDTPALSRINDQHIRQITLKFERALAPSQYRPLLQADLDEFSADPRWKRLRLNVDVDPA